MTKDKEIVKRIMIAAAGSGSGKTVITCALLSILKDRGMNPVSFKCGPDYIDPMFHRSVLGIDSHNLDTYLAGPDGVASVFEDAVSRCGYGFAVIEGVMGIYDGMTPGSLNGSCYEIAGITKTPIVLVADASGVGQTVVSLIKGVLADDRDHLVKGIILNRMSDAFYEKLLPYLREELAKIRDDVEVLGHIPKSDEFVLESRHLGLKLPGEIDGIRERIARAAKIMETGCRTDDVIDIASGAAKAVPEKTRNDGLKHGGAEKCFRENLVEASALDEVSHESSVSYAGTGAGARFRGNIFFRTCIKTFAVARDEAFCFYYPENLQYLEHLGAKIVYFSPIHDKKLPDGTDAILLGGGYPELYLEELARNGSMLDSVRDAIGGGKPSIAECGGFMYLHRMVEDAKGKQYELAGLIDGECRYTGHLVNFGYTQIKALKEDVAGDFREALTGMRGHEFHYYDSTANGSDAILCKPSTGRTYEGMHIGADHIWGWPHLYYLSNTVE